MKIHIVRKGDTTRKIAKKYNIDMDELIGTNSRKTNSDMILPGTKLKIPQRRIQVQRSSKKGNQIITWDVPMVRRFPVIDEDDTWKSSQSIHFKRDNKLKSSPSRTNKKTKHSVPHHAAFQSIRYNPINTIRNLPNEGIPDVNLLQVIPKRFDLTNI